MVYLSNQLQQNQSKDCAKTAILPSGVCHWGLHHRRRGRFFVWVQPGWDQKKKTPATTQGEETERETEEQREGCGTGTVDGS